MCIGTEIAMAVSTAMMKEAIQHIDIRLGDGQWLRNYRKLVENGKYPSWEIHGRGFLTREELEKVVQLYTDKGWLVNSEEALGRTHYNWIITLICPTSGNL